MSFTGNPAFARILGSAMEHYATGNDCEVVAISRANADADLGNSGTTTETPSVLDPEPLLSAITTEAVDRSGGAFWYSDTRMSVLKTALTEDVAMDEKTEFNINGERHIVLAITPCPTTWEYVIRRKTQNVQGS